MANYVIGFLRIINPLCLLPGLLGTSLGTFFGTSPGMASSTGTVLTLPLTYSMGIVNSISLLLGIYIGNISGGLITAILTDIPDTSTPAATTFNGHPMAPRGEGGRATRVGILYSSLRGMVSLVALFLISPILARWALKFSYEEYFSIAALSLSLVSGLSGKSIVKGLVSTFIRVMFTTIGMAPVDTVRRYTSGLTSLGDDLEPLPLMIGIYAVTEMLKVAVVSDQGDMKPLNYKPKGLGVIQKKFKEQFKNLTASSLLGVRIGILPGLGAAISNLIVCPVSKKMSKHPERYGTGHIGGLIASETASNAASGGALVPLLTTGIPGGAGATMLLATFVFRGITPGPLFFNTYSDVIYTMSAILIVANIMTLLIQIYDLPAFLKLFSIPENILLPVAMALAGIGAFAMNNRIFDVWFILFFATMGYGLSWSESPPISIVLEPVLGPIIELNSRRDIMSSYGTFFNFFTCPISETVLILTILPLTIRTVRMIRTRQKTEIDS